MAKKKLDYVMTVQEYLDMKQKVAKYEQENPDTIKVDSFCKEVDELMHQEEGWEATSIHMRFGFEKVIEDEDRNVPRNAALTIGHTSGMSLQATMCRVMLALKGGKP